MGSGEGYTSLSKTGYTTSHCLLCVDRFSKSDEVVKMNCNEGCYVHRYCFLSVCDTIEHSYDVKLICPICKPAEEEAKDDETME